MNGNIEGKIAAILDKTSVVINRGSDQGIEKGTEFYIYTKLGPFFDPDSGESLGETTKIWGKVQATIVEKRFCVAETKYYTSYNFIPMIALENIFRTRVELPVDESDITILAEKIKVGFPVMLVPRIRQIEDKEVLALPDSDSQDQKTDNTDSKQVKKEGHDQEAS
ncbi:MAG: hypothetical protein IMZ53_15805 [Thermoplasmata archaeon]|nr:hypothetical protein [Thermoplasmata archaeon]